jgi:hypothetical protein
MWTEYKTENEVNASNCVRIPMNSSCTSIFSKPCFSRVKPQHRVRAPTPVPVFVIGGVHPAPDSFAGLRQHWSG